MVVAALYSLALLQRTFFGRVKESRLIPDLSRMAYLVLLMMAAMQLWIGWHPGSVLSRTEPAMQYLVPSHPDATPQASRRFPSDAASAPPPSSAGFP